MPSSYTQRGFTIVEVLFSVGIMALLIGLLLMGINAMNRAARGAVEQQNVSSLKMAVDHFEDTFGFLPPLVDDGRISGSDPIAPRQIAGITRPAPVIFDEERDRRFLRGEGPGAAYERYSNHSLAYYLLGALDEEVDGVQGPGFRTPQPDGSFRVSGGQRFEPLFDTSKNPEGVYRGEGEGRVELRDRNGQAYRYYRWIPGNEFGEINESADLNVPELLGSPEENPQLRLARFAIVAAGPNRAFGEAATEGGAAELARKLGRPATDPVEQLEFLGRQDNIVEVGR